MKTILLEIIPKNFKHAVSSEVRQGSYTGITSVYNQINRYFKNKKSALLEVIDLLEKHRRSLNNEKLNYLLINVLKIIDVY
jgi:hypothetical protein